VDRLSSSRCLSPSRGTLNGCLSSSKSRPGSPPSRADTYLPLPWLVSTRSIPSPIPRSHVRGEGARDNALSSSNPGSPLVEELSLGSICYVPSLELGESDHDEEGGRGVADKILCRVLVRPAVTVVLVTTREMESLMGERQGRRITGRPTRLRQVLAADNEIVTTSDWRFLVMPRSDNYLQTVVLISTNQSISCPHRIPTLRHHIASSPWTVGFQQSCSRAHHRPLRGLQIDGLGIR